MPSITFTAPPHHAFALLNISQQMKIPAHAGLREAVRLRIAAAWPEAAPSIEANDPIQKVERPIEISSEEQSALGLGLWDLYMDGQSNDLIRALIKELCAKGRLSLSGWLDGKIKALPPITELLKSDDGPISDEVENAPKPE